MDLLTKVELGGMAGAILAAAIYDWVKKRPVAHARRDLQRRLESATAEFLRTAMVVRCTFRPDQKELLESTRLSDLRKLAFQAASKENRKIAVSALQNRVVGNNAEQVEWDLINSHPDDEVRVAAAWRVRTAKAFVPLLGASSAIGRRAAIDWLLKLPEYAPLVIELFRRESDAGLRTRR